MKPLVKRRFFQLHQHVGSIFAVFLFVILFTGVWSLSQARLALWIQFLPFDSTLLPIDTLLQKGENILGIHGFNEVSLPSVEQPTITFCQTMTACSLTLNAQTGEPITVKDAISPLVTLHKSLFIGFPGRIFISLFGFALALLLITGIVIHHRNIKRLFQLRLFQGKKSFFSDLHNLIGLWSYPWLVMFALTGALSGLGALGTVMLAPYAQPEAPSRIMQQLMGESSPARLPLSATSVSELLITLSQEKPEFIPEVLRWQNKGEINQEMMIGGVNISFPSTSNFEQLLFSGLDYHWIAERSSASQQFWTRSFIAVQPLHYGQYKWTGKASFTLTIIHFFMGLAACLLCFSGLILWIFKKPTTFISRLALGCCVGLIFSSALLIPIAIFSALSPLLPFLSIWLITLIFYLFYQPIIQLTISLLEMSGVVLLIAALSHLFMTQATLWWISSALLISAIFYFLMGLFLLKKQ